MKIGWDDWDRPVFLAPMAGVTDKAFRETVCALGGRYVWTEMISAKALTYRNPHTLQMLDLRGETPPPIVQLFGAEAESMAQAAVLAVERGAGMIDINMGCPTLKIVANQEGAALLRDLPRAEKIAAAVVQATSAPVSVKIRLGWSQREIVAVELARRLEDCGVSLLSVHARTREQQYGGRAAWEWIGRVKEAVKIPVVGNGDVTTPEEAWEMMEQTGCDSVMIGRGALGNPWLIAQAQQFVLSRQRLPGPTPEERIEVALAHFERLLQYKGERIGLNEMRKHAAWYVKGMRYAAVFRDRIMQAPEPEELRKILKEILVSQSAVEEYMKE
ncbi:MAG: tRNA dihydrouridine synthase DusB [Peptococcaceae bacterium]|jgi:nifR3 family TIM-barrel protein|nr:tRNA dihydrouridine synthase DusB [Peptococcaceae bacterium]